MIVYNVTLSLEPSIEQEWLKWMKEVHIPEVMNTGCFKEKRFTKVLNHPDDGINYSVQYLCEEQANLDEYQTKYAPALQKETESKFGGKYIAFRTLLEVIE